MDSKNAIATVKSHTSAVLERLRKIIPGQPAPDLTHEIGRLQESEDTLVAHTQAEKDEETKTVKQEPGQPVTEAAYDQKNDAYDPNKANWQRDEPVAEQK